MIDIVSIEVSRTSVVVKEGKTILPTQKKAGGGFG
jgi:hypothetical protein